MQINEGLVVAVGPGRRDKDGKLLPTSVKEGDKVRAAVGRPAPHAACICLRCWRGHHVWKGDACTVRISRMPKSWHQLMCHMLQVLLPDFGGAPVKLGQDKEKEKE